MKIESHPIVRKIGRHIFIYYTYYALFSPIRAGLIYNGFKKKKTLCLLSYIPTGQGHRLQVYAKCRYV